MKNKTPNKENNMEELNKIIDFLTDQNINSVFRESIEVKLSNLFVNMEEISSTLTLKDFKTLRDCITNDSMNLIYDQIIFPILEKLRLCKEQIRKEETKNE